MGITAMTAARAFISYTHCLTLARSHRTEKQSDTYKPGANRSSKNLRRVKAECIIRFAHPGPMLTDLAVLATFPPHVATVLRRVGWNSPRINVGEHSPRSGAVR